MKYPSEINFKNVTDGICVCYKDSPEVKYNLDIWAISYLLNEKLYQDHKENIVHLHVTDPTMALRMFFLNKFQLFKNIVFDVINAGDFKEKIEDIINGNGKKYTTYSKVLAPRGKRQTQEALLEQHLSEDLSRLSETEFSESDEPITQFPANIFKEEISQEKRSTRKFWIDILAVNRFNQLSVIELKAGSNCPLDILIQAIDYGIYCHLFRKHIADSFFKNSNITDKIALYCVANKFHPGLRGGNGIEGIIPLINKNNGLFDIVLVEIKTKDNKSESKPVIVYDTRRTE